MADGIHQCACPLLLHFLGMDCHPGAKGCVRHTFQSHMTNLILIGGPSWVSRDWNFPAFNLTGLWMVWPAVCAMGPSPTPPIKAPCTMHSPLMHCDLGGGGGGCGGGGRVRQNSGVCPAL